MYDKIHHNKKKKKRKKNKKGIVYGSTTSRRPHKTEFAEKGILKVTEWIWFI